MGHPAIPFLLNQINNPYWCIGHLAGSQLIASGTGNWAYVAIDTPDHDPSKMLTTGASANISAPVTGLYRIECVPTFSGAGSTSALFTSTVRKNGAAFETLYYSNDVDLTAPFTISLGITVVLKIGDYVQLTMEQVTGNGAHLDCSGTIFGMELRRFI